jgi:hypothetical protein
MTNRNLSLVAPLNPERSEIIQKQDTQNWLLVLPWAGRPWIE